MLDRFHFSQPQAQQDIDLSISSVDNALNDNIKSPCAVKSAFSNHDKEMLPPANKLPHYENIKEDPLRRLSNQHARKTKIGKYNKSHFNAVDRFTNTHIPTPRIMPRLSNVRGSSLQTQVSFESKDKELYPVKNNYRAVLNTATKVNHGKKCNMIYLQPDLSNELLSDFSGNNWSPTPSLTDSESSTSPSSCHKLSESPDHDNYQDADYGCQTPGRGQFILSTPTQERRDIAKKYFAGRESPEAQYYFTPLQNTEKESYVKKEINNMAHNVMKYGENNVATTKQFNDPCRSLKNASCQYYIPSFVSRSPSASAHAYHCSQYQSTSYYGMAQQEYPRPELHDISFDSYGNQGYSYNIQTRPSPFTFKNSAVQSISVPSTSQCCSNGQLYGGPTAAQMSHIPLQSLHNFVPYYDDHTDTAYRSVVSKELSHRLKVTNPEGFPPLSQTGSNASKDTLLSSKEFSIPDKSGIDTESLGSPASPLPQNLKCDPHRQAKVKTELCLYYLRGSKCPFGARCNYAHGKDELKYTKLWELQQAGLIDDIKTYRTHPCISWVATGACPFGQRCNHIHDPRISGSCPSWLPHSEASVNSLPTKLNSDKFYHRSIGSLHQENPLIHSLIWEYRDFFKKNIKKKSRIFQSDRASKSMQDQERKDWHDTYALVCNSSMYSYLEINGNSNLDSSEESCTNMLHSNSNSFSPPKELSELQRLHIAVIMSYNSINCPSSNADSHRNYIYNPRHIFCNDLCMILQTRYFCIPKTKGLGYETDSLVKEISLEEYTEYQSPWDKHHSHCPLEVIVVRELAFGPVGDASAKVSLWFDIPASDIVACTHQQIKRHKRTKQRLSQQQKSNEYGSTTSGNEIFFTHARSENNANFSLDGACFSENFSVMKSFLRHPCKPFFHMQPILDDDVSHGLLRSILLHRINVLKFMHLTGEAFAKEGNRLLKCKEMELQKSFKNLKRYTSSWNWPNTIDRNINNPDMPVPQCSSKYTPASKAEAASCIWESFMRTAASREFKCDGDGQTNSTETKEGKKLDIFSRLSCGKKIEGTSSSANILPHISNHSDHPAAFSVGTNQDRNAWKSILLSASPENDKETNEWDIIKRHYLTNMEAGLSGNTSSIESGRDISRKVDRVNNIPLSPVLNKLCAPLVPRRIDGSNSIPRLVLSS